MKQTIRYTILTALSVLSTLSCILLSSCNTIKAIPLSYAENDDKEVAYVYFDLYKKSEISGATFVTYDEKNTPQPEKLTYYSPVVLPAGVPIKMTLHLYYKEPRSDFGDDSMCAACCTTVVNSFEAARDVNTDIVFNIPALEPYVDYQISYRKGSGIPGSSFVTLIRMDTKEVIVEREYK